MGPESVEGVCEVEVVAGREAPAGAPPGLLIEVPHGATRSLHYEKTRQRLVGEYSDDLKEFFHVNTDVGSIEVARHVARAVAGSADVLIVRGLIPRTFVDCNRVLEGGPSAEVREGITPGLPGYVSDPEDVRTLTRMHEEYQVEARKAYEAVCGKGGSALVLHTYAPRSVEIDRVDDGIVAALHRAYEPEMYDSWDRRPDVDVISEDVDGDRLAPPAMVQRLREAYAALGISVAENRTYRLFPGTMGYVQSKRYPQRVTCVEINRALLVQEFRPFEEMRIDDAKARRMAGPIATAGLGG